MRKIGTLLLLLLNVWGLVSAECTLTKPQISQGTFPPNEVPPTTGGEIYVGSAPLRVMFTCESNSLSLLWTYYKTDEPDVIYTIDRNKQEVSHTFDRFGSYIVAVEALDEGCDGAKESVQIGVSESLLEVPNLMSPNGDNYNDNFCVAYRSIVKYQCYVYNRWGRQVFSSSRPDVCWDGTIGGKPADIGAYYYVIEAEGVEGHHYKLGGDINLVR